MPAVIKHITDKTPDGLVVSVWTQDRDGGTTEWNAYDPQSEGNHRRYAWHAATTVEEFAFHVLQAAQWRASKSSNAAAGAAASNNNNSQAASPIASDPFDNTQPTAATLHSLPPKLQAVARQLWIQCWNKTLAAEAQVSGTVIRPPYVTTAPVTLLPGDLVGAKGSNNNNNAAKVGNLTVCRCVEQDTPAGRNLVLADFLVPTSASRAVASLIGELPWQSWRPTVIVLAGMPSSGKNICAEYFAARLYRIYQEQHEQKRQRRSNAGAAKSNNDDEVAARSLSFQNDNFDDDDDDGNSSSDSSSSSSSSSSAKKRRRRGKNNKGKQEEDYRTIPFHRFFRSYDLNQCKTVETSSRFLGSSRGYQGGKGNLVRDLQAGAKVFYLDEFEKACREVKMLFGGLFENGVLTDNSEASASVAPGTVFFISLNTTDDQKEKQPKQEQQQQKQQQQQQQQPEVTAGSLCHEVLNDPAFKNCNNQLHLPDSVARKIKRIRDIVFDGDLEFLRSRMSAFLITSVEHSDVYWRLLSMRFLEDVAAAAGLTMGLRRLCYCESILTRCVIPLVKEHGEAPRVARRAVERLLQAAVAKFPTMQRMGTYDVKHDTAVLLPSAISEQGRELVIAVAWRRDSSPLNTAVSGLPPASSSSSSAGKKKQPQTQQQQPKAKNNNSNTDENRQQVQQQQQTAKNVDALKSLLEEQKAETDKQMNALREELKCLREAAQAREKQWQQQQQQQQQEQQQERQKSAAAQATAAQQQPPQQQQQPKAAEPLSEILTRFLIGAALILVIAQVLASTLSKK